MSHHVTNEDSDKCGDRTFACDHVGCDEVYDGFGTFAEVWAAAKAEGWKTIKEGRSWSHYCPDHKEQIR